MLRSISPTTNTLIAEYSEMSPEEVKAIVQVVHEEWQRWRKTDINFRSTLMRRLAGVLQDGSERYARLMSDEMGKPITVAKAEITKCAWVCEYYADHAAAFLSDESVVTEAAKSYVSYQPLGVVLAVMPWNFPLWQVFRFAAPAVMAGNAALLKHASNVTGCALAMETMFRLAGFPENLFRAVLVPGHRVVEVIADRNVQAVTLTGSVQAGRAVAMEAGRYLKKTVLELGGSDPYLVLADADISHAAVLCAKSRMINGGQSCIAAKRVIVVESVYDAFVAKVVEEMKSYIMGGPLDEKTQFGPMAMQNQRDALHEQVKQSVAKGAHCVLGGKIPEGDGAYYPATVLTEVAPGMPAYDEELFGPVMAVIRAKDEADAVRIANDSVFGLGAAVFTQNVGRGEEIARQELQSGCCVVNDFVKSDPRLPFGGVRESGYGRELSYFGIREFVNIKAVVVG